MNTNPTSPFRAEFTRETSLIEKLAGIVALVSLAISFYLVASSWESIPERIPIHFGVSGNPDRWGDRYVLLVVTFVQAVLFLLLTFFCRRPKFFNLPLWLEQASREKMIIHVRQMLIFLNAEIMAMLTFIIWTTIQVAIGTGQSLSVKYMILFMAAILGTAAWYFVRLIRAR